MHGPRFALPSGGPVTLRTGWCPQPSICTGGIGADVEYPIHRFFLMAKQISFSLGNASQQLEKLGQLLASDDSLGFRALEV